ncbi:hypothetical protein HAZT_HAZT005378 [Hyalella azteca]|uniref:Amidase domain-containing protein n=1 Tax=Hyalella azteca TaxID=294128 RepID=A0A6A0GS40_HYAAZ|nr:hypothetical protein HAZT_HAZT005378 [Hyalella azteca]
MEKILSLTLTELGHAYRKDLVSVKQVVQQVMAQMRVMEDLNAIITVAPHARIRDACDAAQERQDRHEMLGPLDGVPVVVKDNYCTSWCRTTCASNMLSNYTPPYSATLVNRLEAAGAIIIGKSNMDEFGMGSGGTNSVFGATRNLFRSGKPYKLCDSQLRCDGLPGGAWVASGGSSGGSAVAVVAGLAYGGLGSDTGGSVRNPASVCGLVGLKPSYGTLSRHGLVSLANSLDCPGVLARSCADCAALMHVLLQGGPDHQDSTNVSVEWGGAPLQTCSVRGLRVGVPAEYHCVGLHAQVLRAWRQVADVLARAGAQVCISYDKN